MIKTVEFVSGTHTRQVVTRNTCLCCSNTQSCVCDRQRPDELRVSEWPTFSARSLSGCSQGDDEEARCFWGSICLLRWFEQVSTHIYYVREEHPGDVPVFVFFWIGMGSSKICFRFLVQSTYFEKKISKYILIINQCIKNIWK